MLTHPILRFAAHRRSLVLLAAMALQWPAAAPAASQLSVSANGTYAPSGYNPNATGISAPLSKSFEGSGQYGADKSSATASYGVLRTYAESSITPNPFSAFGSASAGWVDTFLIGSPLLNGQQGRVTFSFRVDGTLSGAGNEPVSLDSNQTRATASLDVYTGGSFSSFRYERLNINTGQLASNSTPFLNQTLTYSVDFIFGTPFEFGLRVISSTQSFGNYYYTANAKSDLSHTATWGGFDSVTTVGGVPVPRGAYTFSSGSGADFTQAIVPEPGTSALLLLAGAGTLGVVLRRRRVVLG